MRFIQFLKHVCDRMLVFIVGLLAAFAAIMKRLRWIPVAAALSFIPIVQSADAQDDITDPEVWLVDGDNGDDLNDGQGSWADARETIQSVINDGDFGSGDRIWVASSTTPYKPGTAAGSTFLLEDGTWLLGGFDTSDTNRKDANPYENETILSGNLSGGGNAYHVVTAIEPTDDGPHFTRLDGFIIEGGDASGDTTSGHIRGGGLIMRNANQDPADGNFWLKVSRCRFRDNNASRGGAVAVYRPLNGSASADHDLELTNCEFTGNTAINGGAVWTFGSDIRIYNSLFVDNTATNQGGAIWTNGGDVQISNSVVVDNGATSESGTMRSELLALTWSAYNTIDESEPRPQGSGVRRCAHHAPMYSTR